MRFDNIYDIVLADLYIGCSIENKGALVVVSVHAGSLGPSIFEIDSLASGLDYGTLSLGDNPYFLSRALSFRKMHGQKDVNGTFSGSSLKSPRTRG